VLIQDGVTGRLVPGDAVALARTLRELLADPLAVEALAQVVPMHGLLFP